LGFDTLEHAYPQTKIVDKRLEDFRQATSDMLGRSKFKGTLHPSIDENFTFGVKNVLSGAWNVAQCIHGDPEEKTSKHYEPDPDLGKTVLHRSKLINLQPKEIDPEKTFGVPSIRGDLKRTKPASVCDMTVRNLTYNIFKNYITILNYFYRIMEMKKMPLNCYILIFM
jgi:hypothetical protein